MAQQRERRMANATLQQQHGFDYPPHAAVVVPERMNPLEAQPHQRRAQDRWLASPHQRAMPADQSIEQPLDVPAVSGWLVWVAVGAVPDVGDTASGDVANRARPVVRAGRGTR